MISPWDRGTVDGPAAGPAQGADHRRLPRATGDGDARHGPGTRRRSLEQHVHPPLRATQSGFASVSRALQEETIDATERAELLAAPLLLLVLLLVFRSVVAAAIPLAFGALTVFAGRGVLVLLSSVMTIDAISLVVCTMMGLALGVDYSLLIVSRFREELEPGREPARGGDAQPGDAPAAPPLFAGSTLLAALALSAFVQPGSLLLSLAATVGVATILSVLVAVAGAAAAARPCSATRVNAGRIGRTTRRPSRHSRGRRRWPRAALRRPGLAAVLIAIPLVAARRPGPRPQHRRPGIDELPTSNQARAERGRRSTAPSGPAGKRPSSSSPPPPEGPITTPERLAPARPLAAADRRRSPGSAR